jgi:hypothetical protein
MSLLGYLMMSDLGGAQHRLLCNPGVVSEYPTCFYAGAAVNWFENKVNQFTAARTPCETRAAQSRPRCA